jgi:uncharacterized RDD family membrane protein YckC
MTEPQRPVSDHPLRPNLPAQREQSSQEYTAPSPYAEVSRPYPPATEADLEEPYARWWQRVLATLIDLVLQLPFLVVMVIGWVMLFHQNGPYQLHNGHLLITPSRFDDTAVTGLVISNVAGLANSAFAIWNQVVRQGRRGASIGKACLHLMVVSESDGLPIGAVMTFVRSWAHLLDQVTLGIGYLWPLWDHKRQTFADMAMKTAVLHLPPLPPQAPPPSVPQQASPPYGW